MDPGVFNGPEADDYLHNPDPRRKHADGSGHIFTGRGLVNLGCLLILVGSMLALLYVLCCLCPSEVLSNVGFELRLPAGLVAHEAQAVVSQWIQFWRH